MPSIIERLQALATDRATRLGHHLSKWTVDEQESRDVSVAVCRDCRSVATCNTRPQDGENGDMGGMAVRASCSPAKAYEVLNPGSDYVIGWVRAPSIPTALDKAQELNDGRPVRVKRRGYPGTQVPCFCVYITTDDGTVPVAITPDEEEAKDAVNRLPNAHY